jgi:hypothetical protein
MSEFDKKELKLGIAIAVRDFDKLSGSIEGQSISINDLWFLLPAYTIEDIIAAIKDMKDVKTIDAENGIFYFPKHSYTG